MLTLIDEWCYDIERLIIAVPPAAFPWIRNLKHLIKLERHIDVNILSTDTYTPNGEADIHTAIRAALKRARIDGRAGICKLSTLLHAAGIDDAL